LSLSLFAYRSVAAAARSFYFLVRSYEKVLIPASVFRLPGGGDRRLIFFRLAKFLFPPIGKVASAHWKAKMSPSRAEKLFLGINIF
jgi:hypothetical protein